MDKTLGTPFKYKSHRWRRADPLELREGGTEQSSPDRPAVTGQGLPGHSLHTCTAPTETGRQRHARKPHAALRLSSRRPGHHILELSLRRARFRPLPGTYSEVQSSKARKGEQKAPGLDLRPDGGWPHISPTELGREPMPGAGLGLASLSRSPTEGEGIC